MKIGMIRTYDMGAYQEKLEEFYKTTNVDHVDTHTEVLNVRHEDLVYYIAIVFYRDKVENVNLEINDKCNITFEALNLPTRIHTILNWYNRYVEEGKYNVKFYNKKIDTVNDLIEMIKSEKIYRLKGMGAHSVDIIKQHIVDLMEGKDESK